MIFILLILIILSMNLLHGVGDFFSLDLGTNSMRLIQLNRGANGGFVLSKYAYVPIDQRITQDSSDLGKRHLGEAILGAVNQAGIRTKNIALGLPSNKTFTSIVETEKMPDKELRKAFSYEIDKYVPMPMDEAKVDYIALGPSPVDPEKVEMLVSSTAKEYAETQLEVIEKVGLNVVAMEPECLAMARALNPVGAINATMIVDMGEHSSDIVVMYQNQPRLVRAVHGGFELFVKTVANTLNVREDQARQFILRFGLAQDKVEGQVFRVLSSVLESYVGELVKSFRFLQTKYPNMKIDNIILSSFAANIPLFPEYIEAKTNIPAMIGNPWQLVQTTESQQQALINVASEFAVAIGLAERSNE